MSRTNQRVVSVYNIVILCIDNLTCFTHFYRDFEFGIKDRHTNNINVKVKLDEFVGTKSIAVQVNGTWEEEKAIKDESLSKEQLAVKPRKYVTKSRM